MRRLIFLGTMLFLLFQSGLAAASSDGAFETLVSRFVPEYKALKIPDLELSYVENLEKIQNLAGLSRQETLFRKYLPLLKAIDRGDLSVDNRYQLDTLVYQLELDRTRLQLEKRFKQHPPAKIPDNGILQVPNGRNWYLYFMQKWAGPKLTPASLFQFGMSEVRRVRAEMSALQAKLGFQGKDREFFAHLNNPFFTLTDETELLKRLTNFRALIDQNLKADFEPAAIALVDIKPIANPTKDTPPGYYKEGAFYYNFLGNRFPGRSLEWLFIHEAVPGHHYQISLSPTGDPLQEIFWYPGFSEGWAAYTEDLGKDLGAFTDPYQYYGKWEWDLVRSIRIALDVGINYFGWTKAQALNFWKLNVPNQDAIAEREVDRMFRWPAQVLAYKVGERKFWELRKASALKRGRNFDLRKFHTLVLKRGSLPLPVLESVVKEDLP